MKLRQIQNHEPSAVMLHQIRDLPRRLNDIAKLAASRRRITLNDFIIQSIQDAVIRAAETDPVVKAAVKE